MIKDQHRSKRGRQQASTLQTSNDVQSSIPSLPLSHDDRVLPQFTDGKWYAGNIHGDYSKGHLVLFDVYESHGASKIVFHQIKPYITDNETITSTDQTSSVQSLQITSTLQLNEGQPPSDGTIRWTWKRRHRWKWMVFGIHTPCFPPVFG